jgi:hypothetical protein
LRVREFAKILLRSGHNSSSGLYLGVVMTEVDVLAVDHYVRRPRASTRSIALVHNALKAARIVFVLATVAVILLIAGFS